MRGLGSMVGLLVVALIAMLAYKFYFSQAHSPETATPVQTVNLVGVKNDLIAIAQAERAYGIEHGSFVSLDELISSGAVTMTKSNRAGYTYDIETSSDGFHVVAHCPTATMPGCSNYTVDQTMEVRTAP
jgi:competence protein ComGC